MPPHTCHSIRAQWRSFYFNNKKKEEENEKKAGRKVAKKKRREKERKKKKPSGGVLRYRAHYATQYGRQFRFAIKSDSLSSFYFASFRGHDGGVSVVLLFSISSADSHSHTHSGRSTSGRCRTFLRNWIFFCALSSLISFFSHGVIGRQIDPLRYVFPFHQLDCGV